MTTASAALACSPGEVVAITPERQWRYADMIHDAARNRLIAVREDHEAAFVAKHGEWGNDLVAIDLRQSVDEIDVTENPGETGSFYIGWGLNRYRLSPGVAIKSAAREHRTRRTT